jgi:hypothetical protein
MSVKEIRELENDIVEVSNADRLQNGDEGLKKGSWVEKDFVDKDAFEEEEEDVEDKGFSIEDTMLSRGKERGGWDQGRDLEESVEFEEVSDFDEDDSSEGFSYNVAGGPGDSLYGNVAGDMYNKNGGMNMYNDVSGPSGGVGYNTAGSPGTVGYDTGGGSKGVAYNGIPSVDDAKGKKSQGLGYDTGMSKKKKKRRLDSVSGLEKGVRKRKKEGLSMI